MSNLQAAATTIGMFAIMGAFLDFYIGKEGQKRIREKLETWWLYLSYVDIHNAPSKEAKIAHLIMSKLFGDRLFSVRRLVGTSLCLALSTVVFSAIWAQENYFEFSVDDISTIFQEYVGFIARISISLSITIIAAKQMSAVKSHSLFFSVIVIMLMLFLQVLILLAPNYLESEAAEGVEPWIYALNITALDTALDTVLVKYINEHWASAISLSLRSIIAQPFWLAQGMWIGFISLVTELYVPEDVTTRCAANFPTDSDTLLFSVMPYMASGCAESLIAVLRAVIFVLFLLALLARPLHHVTLTLWQRVVESDKPVFTLIFGGIGAGVKVVEELVKLLGGAAA